MGRKLEIQLLGSFHLVCDGKAVSGLESPRLQSFLAYLLIHRDIPLSRQQLSFLFWPDSSESQARTNLRNVLFRLKEALPAAEECLEISPQTIWWHPDVSIWLDVVEFEDAVAHTDITGSGSDQQAHREALTAAVEAYAGDLLPGCYDDWIHPIREGLSQTYLRVLEELVDTLDLSGETSQAIQHAQKLLRYDPLHEASCRRLMELYNLTGDKARALRTYHSCVDALEKELGLDPSPDTIALYQEILDREAPALEPARVTEKGSRLVGRETAWERLQNAWQGTEKGAHLVVILGEAGIGKTFLAEEFIRWARREGITCLITHSYPAETRLAYTPLTALLRSDPVQARLSSLDKTWQIELARLLPELLEKHPELPEPEQLTESWQRGRMFEASARALLEGENQLVLFLDDLQWCDQETLDLLQYLLQYKTRARVLVISAARTEDLVEEHPLIPFFSALERGDRITEILLERLDWEATRILASSLWGEQLGEGDTTRLFQETEGNPLFVAEMVRAGYFAGAEKGTSPPTLPPRVQAVIETRLNKLSSSARDLANLAAVGGREFDYELLFRAGEGTEEAVLQGLDELWGRRLIRDEGEGYNFSHDKFREVIYQELSPHRRMFYHARIAEALEDLHHKNLVEVASQLAVHFDLSGKGDQAAGYYLIAGDQARRLYARQNAIQHYQRAAALLGDQTDQRLIQLYQGWGEVLLKLASYQEARESYQRMASAARSVGDTRAEARAWLAIGKVQDRQGNHQGALESAERTLKIAEENQFQTELAEAVLLKGQSFYRLGLVPEAETFIRDALQLCQRDQDPFTHSRCLSLLGLIQDDLGHYQAARVSKEQALEAIKDIEGDWVKEWIGTLYNNLANTANLAGNDQEAVTSYLQALEIFKETKNQDMIIMCQVNMGAARIGLGECQLAEEGFRQVLELTEGTGWLGLSLTCHFLAEACLGQGKLDQAQEAALQALGYARETGAQQALGAAWRSLGKVSSEMKAELEVDGKPCSAGECFQTSAGIFRELKADGERAHTLKAWAAHELQKGDKKQGRKLWAEARELFQRLEMTAEVERMDRENPA